MGSVGFVRVSLSKTGRSWGLRGTSGSLGKSLGSSRTLEAGVDTKLKEGEDAVLCRGELEEEGGSPKSGRYGLLGRVFISADGVG